MAASRLIRVVAVFTNKTVYQKTYKCTSLIRRRIHSQAITSNLQYLSNDKLNVKIDPKTLKFERPVSRPLCIMLSWILSKEKHLQKYAKIYLDLGFDVTTVTCTPWQAMWPVRGSQLIAADLLKFLEVNEEQKPLVVHGFSVGAYLWAELLVQVMRDRERYQPLMERVVAQVWDSPADVDELPVGMTNALFPKNKFMQKALSAYIKTHMAVFYNVATQHYLRATAAYHCPPCGAPALFLVSRTDVIGTERRSRRARDMMTEVGIKCNWKCWDDSPHVRHYNKYPDEYLSALYSHFEECGLLVPEVQAKRVSNL